MAGQLGQTTNPRDLIPGDPTAIAADLRALVQKVQTVDGAGDRLSRIDAANWRGDASKAFRDSYVAEPPKWTQAANLLAGGGQALADYGTTLAWGQGQAQQAIELYTQAQAATRSASAAHDTRVQFGMPVGPFVDPGAKSAQEAQTILDNARGKVAKSGDDAATALGFEPDGKGGFTKKLGGKNYGTDRRKPHHHYDKKQKKWVTDDDPNGWQRTKGGRNYKGKWGNQSDGQFGDTLNETLKGLGINLPEATAGGSAGTDVAHAGADGGFHTGPVSGHGSVQASVLGADGEWHASASPLAVSVGADGEVYLGKASASGDLNLGPHIGAHGEADASVGAHGSADASVGPFGGHASVDASIGAEANVQGSGEVAGVKVGGHAGADFGLAAGGSANVGFDHGKLHAGGSIHISVGPGFNIGTDVSVDPGAMISSVGDAGKALEHGAGSVIKSITHFHNPFG
jgi:hypothetical protein